MVSLSIPDDLNLMAAVGAVAVRHGQLDYVLRMTVKSILSMSVREALDATSRQGSYDLRVRVRRLARERIGEGEDLAKLDALLARARRATDRRNEILHTLWAYNRDGEPVIRDDDGHGFKPIPHVAEVQALANGLAAVAEELNNARAEGFLSEALQRSPRRPA